MKFLRSLLVLALALAMLLSFAACTDEEVSTTEEKKGLSETEQEALREGTILEDGFETPIIFRDNGK